MGHPTRWHSARLDVRTYIVFWLAHVTELLCPRKYVHGYATGRPYIPSDAGSHHSRSTEATTHEKHSTPDFVGIQIK